MPRIKKTRRNGQSNRNGRSRGNPNTRGRSRLVTTLITLVILACAGIAVTYWYIDQKVARALILRSGDITSAVYSDARRFPLSQAMPTEALLVRLQRSRYRETNTSPPEPGTYVRHNGAIEFTTREFADAQGLIVASQQLRFDLENRHFSYLSNNLPDYFQFEPEIISVLGSGEQRASQYKTLKSIPLILQQAVLAIEDERFYQHFGIDLLGIARAMVTNLRALDIVQGGSTITQQLAKNLMFSPRRTLGRKVMEVFAALSLENKLTKNEILERYLNEVYLGQEGSVALHGVAQAAKSFFGREIDEISLNEAALLAGIIKAPSAYSPRRHPKRAEERRQVALKKMLALGFIDVKRYERAVRAVPTIIKEMEHRRTSDYFISALERDLGRQIDLEGAILSGLNVNTGLDMDLQACAEQAVERGLLALERDLPSLVSRSGRAQAGLLALEPFSGKVRAWVGGRDYTQSQFDHVDLAKRQVGSTVKPFLYLLALDPNLMHDKVFTPMSVLSDRPLTIELPNQTAWSPLNFDKQFRGDVTLRYVLENSLNVPTVRVIQEVGLRNLMHSIHNFRLADDLLEVPALALGAFETTLLKLTAAYGALANGGIYVTPRSFINTRDAAGNVLAQADINEERLVSEEISYVLTNLLQGVIERGSGKGVRAHGFQHPAAGKTGTSDDTRDAWFVGFVPEMVAGVWIGFDDNRRLGLSGGRAAAPIWANFMRCANNFYQFSDFISPTSVELVKVDFTTQERATENCPPDTTVTEIFVPGTAPRTYCSEHPGASHGAIPGRETKSPHKERRSFWERLFD